jgi:predicted SAM-dependent methyltransferase
MKMLARRHPIRVVVGASGVYQRGWIATDVEHLDILRMERWRRYFRESSIDGILAEHVLEHLTEEQGLAAARNFHVFLKVKGYARVAVPDGFHPSAEYIRQVRPGGAGAGAEDHKVLYNYRSLSRIFEESGYRVNLLEYFDENGTFHFREWDTRMGMITRSKLHDDRNLGGRLLYTSVILDAVKE